MCKKNIFADNIRFCKYPYNFTQFNLHSLNSVLMKLLKNHFCLVCIILATQLLCAQEVIPVSGGEATGSNGSGSYTVGQVFYTTYLAPDLFFTDDITRVGSVSQGVQQPFELQTLSNPSLTTVKLTAATYPNPTKDFIILKISDTALDNLSYTLFDVTGKAISNGGITNRDTQIAMQQLAIGIYILKVNRDNQELKTFKIIKK